MKRRKKRYYCRYCGKKHDSFAMAELCFDLDMKQLQHPSKEKNLISDKFISLQGEKPTSKYKPE